MALSDAQIKALRKGAAGRKRRIVFHSDGQPLERILAHPLRLTTLDSV